MFVSFGDLPTGAALDRKSPEAALLPPPLTDSPVANFDGLPVSNGCVKQAPFLAELGCQSV